MNEISIVYFRIEKPEQLEEINDHLDQIVAKPNIYPIDEHDPVLRPNQEYHVLCTLDHYPSFVEKNQIKYSNEEVEDLCKEHEDKKPNYLAAFENILRKNEDILASEFKNFLSEKNIPYIHYIQKRKIENHNLD